MPQWAKTVVLAGVGLLILFAVLEPRLSRDSDGGESSDLPAASAGSAAGSGADGQTGQSPATSGDTAAAPAPAVETVSEFEAAQARIEEDPEDAGAWQALGALLLADGAYAPAAEAFAQAIDIDPERARSRADLGVALLYQGMMRVARAEFQRAVAIDPGLADAHLNLGITYSHVTPADLPAARSAWEQVIALAPESQLAEQAQAYLATYVAEPAPAVAD